MISYDTMGLCSTADALLLYRDVPPLGNVRYLAQQYQYMLGTILNS